MQKALVIYDGQCKFCRKSRELIGRLDLRGRLSFMRLEDEDVYRRFPSLDRNECKRELKIVLEDGRVLGGGEALIALWSLLPPTLPLGLLCRLPPLKALVKWSYRKWAKERYRTDRLLEWLIR